MRVALLEKQRIYSNNFLRLNTNDSPDKNVIQYNCAKIKPLIRSKWHKNID